jgi:hypothetical protein
MITKPKVRKRRVFKLVELYGGGTSTTKIWEKMVDAARLEILKTMTLTPDEEPLVGSFLRADLWSLATTERFIWKNCGVQESSRYNNARCGRVLDTVAPGGRGLRYGIQKSIGFLELGI